MLISQSLSPTALRNGARPAFRYLKPIVTYKQFWDTTNRFSYYLQKEIKHGLRVGLWMSNCPHVAYCFLALANTKNCTVPLNPWASPEENLFKIKNSELSVILCSSDHFRTLREFLQKNSLGAIKVIEMESKRCAEYDTTYSPPSSHFPVDKDEILLLYTPGSTGKYKGCLFNHNSVIQAMTGVKNAYRASMADVFYTQQHYSTGFSLIHFLMAPLMAGSTVFISDQVDYKTVLSDLTEFRVTRFAPKISTLPELCRTSESEKLPFPTVRNIVVNGTTLNKTTWALLKKTTKANVVNVYGLTEYLGTVAMGTPDVPAQENKPGFIGPPLVGTKIRVVDDNNDEIEKKKPQKGQLLVMGQCLMSKYLDLPEDQKQTVRGTWLFTGDMVDINAEGQITFNDRKADVVTLQSGKKIFAREVEPIVKTIPQVEEAAYVGVRDRLKKPVAAIVIVRKAQAQLNEKQVRDFLAMKVPSDKVPGAIFFIDAMPRTVSGAINRAKLRSLYDGV